MSKEGTLRRLGIRLSHLVDSDDKQLHQLLDALRQDLADNVGTRELEQHSSNLAKQVLLLQERKQLANNNNLSINEFGNEIARAIRALRFDKDSNQKLGEVARRVQRADKLEQQLRSITDVLHIAQSAKTYRAGRSGGKRSWLGGRTPDQLQDFIGHASLLLDDVVTHIDVLNGDTSETKTVRQQLERGLDSDSLGSVIDDVVELVRQHSARIEEERGNTQHFLGTLRDRLITAEEALYTLIGDSDASGQRADSFNSTLNNEVQTLAEAAQAQDIHTMRDSLAKGLSDLNNHLNDYFASEQENRQKNRKQIEDLNRRLRQIEEEARHLRGQIKKKQDLTVKDPLTTVYNRAGFDERIEEEFTRMRRIKAPLSLVFIDCNKFKEINDSFGHAAGDVVLVQIAKTLSNRARVTDVIARYGGDEFVVILPDTDTAGAKCFA
ncbi:MAG: hypothetical protein CSA53_05115, partial [Gammaproteobacteria bacterium]